MDALRLALPSAVPPDPVEGPELASPRSPTTDPTSERRSSKRARTRVLLLESDPSEAGLVRAHLARSRRHRFQIAQATGLRAALDALSSGEIDLVLADLRPPSPLGPAACESLLDAHPQVPCVLLTDREGGSAGGLAARRGAEELRVGDRVEAESLLRAVQRAVERHAAAARAERAVRESRQRDARFAVLIARSPVPMLVLDASGLVRFVNPAAEALFERPPREILGSTLLLPPRGGRPGEVTVERGDGSTLPASVDATDIEWEGRPAQLVSLNDLSDRKRVECIAHAQSVQRAFLPARMARRTGVLEVAGLNEPCQDASGDYYDLLDLTDGRLAVPIGDVAGHGLGAALIMAQGRAALRAYCESVRGAPAVVSRLNDALAADMRQGRFMSLLLTTVHPRTGRVAWCNAGHVPALRLRARTGQVERLEATGPVLGVVPGARYTAGRGFVLEPRDVLLLFTDGATEAVNPRGEQFGEERIGRVLRSTATWSAQEIVDALWAALRTWTAELPLRDDLTMVAIRRAGAAGDDPGEGAPQEEPPPSRPPAAR